MDTGSTSMQEYSWFHRDDPNTSHNVQQSIKQPFQYIFLHSSANTAFSNNYHHKGSERQKGGGLTLHQSTKAPLHHPSQFIDIYKVQCLNGWMVAQIMSEFH